MFVFTITDIRNGKGYTGKSEEDPSNLLNPRLYMKTNNLPIYEIIRKQGVDWFKLEIVGYTEQVYKDTIKKIHDYNTPEEYTPRPKRNNGAGISRALKEYYVDRPSPFKGKTHPNLYYWQGKKGPNQFSWLVTYKNRYGEEVTETIDNLRDWVKSLGLSIGKVKWRYQHKSCEKYKKPFPYGPILDIKRLSTPKWLESSKNK